MSARPFGFLAVFWVLHHWIRWLLDRGSGRIFTQRRCFCRSGVGKVLALVLLVALVLVPVARLLPPPKPVSSADPSVTAMVAAGMYHILGLKSDGTVLAIGGNEYGQCDVGSWSYTRQVSAGVFHTVGLESDGTVVAVGSNGSGQCDVGSWSGIQQVAAGDHHTLGLRSDGTVLAVGSNGSGQCDVGSWSGIQQVAGGSYHTVGLESDGTVVAVGLDDDGQCDLNSWTGIQQVAAGYFHTVGLRSDGTVVAVGSNHDGQCSVDNWTDMQQVAAGTDHTVGLKSDGTVVAVGGDASGKCDVGSWTDIRQVAAGDGYTLGLRSDGTLVATGRRCFGQCNVGSWSVIHQVGAGDRHTVGLRSDGSVVAVGSDMHGQCDAGSWVGIQQVAAGYYQTFGLRSDNTVVAVGMNGYGECNVDAWTDIQQLDGGGEHTVGLKSDGTVVAVGSLTLGQCDVGSWTDIRQVSAGGLHTLGLVHGGAVVATGFNVFGQCDVDSWTGIEQVSAGGDHTVGLESDGTAVAVGRSNHGQCDVDSWISIQQLSTGYEHTVGLKSDGTVVAVGSNDYGQCNVGSWSGIQEVYAGLYHTVGLKSDGTVVAAGLEIELANWNLGVMPNESPVAPGNVSPVNTATGLSLTPALQSSAFSDPDAGDAHAASQWQVKAGSGTYASATFDSGTDTSNLTSISIPSGKLTYSTTYYWHVRHQDNHGAWSEWSNETAFTTILSASDTTTPAAVADLAATAATSSSVTLTWTSPGDDGNTGTASTYDIRYSTATITDANWGSAIQCSGGPAPKVAGSAETFTVTGLSPNTLYYFAIKTADEVPNWSGLSNVRSRQTEAAADTTPPGTVGDLAAATATASSVTLTWTSPGDDGSSGTATTYDIRYSTATITDGTWGSASQCSSEPAPKVAGSAETFTATGLAPNTIYYFAIETADEVPNWSTLSKVVSKQTATVPSAMQIAGKGIWIWELSKSDGGDVGKIAERLVNSGVTWVAIKAGDSDSFWTGANELTADVVSQLHNSGISVLGWQYVYSYDRWDIPAVSEADVANRILDIPGIDGLIVDAEAEYQGHPEAATQYMQAIRDEHPASFVAYAPFPIIDYHTSFPYVEFGKYADAVMPQAYWQAIGVGPGEIVTWTKQQWDKWNNTWEASGYGESVKPIIPIGQGYDVVAGEITTFCNAVVASGYNGVSLWRYDTMTDEMWSAYAGVSPDIDDVNPGSGKRKQHLTVTISGSNFDGATDVSFGSGIVVEDFSVISCTQITVEITIDADAAKGARDVSVMTGLGTATKTDGFSVAGSGGGICSAGAPATPGAPSEMTIILAALGVLLGAGYFLVRRGSRTRRDSVRA